MVLKRKLQSNEQSVSLYAYKIHLAFDAMEI